jgi:hypothetical protein
MKIYRISQDKFRKSPVPPIPLHQKGGYEEGKKREEIICNAIRKLAKEWDVGPIKEPLYIDSYGDIMMLQEMCGPIDYKSSKEIDPDLQDIAREYNKGYGPGLSSRWIRLNHFAWEKMLGDMGLLPRHEVSEEEFIKDISR